MVGKCTYCGRANKDKLYHCFNPPQGAGLLQFYICFLKKFLMQCDMYYSNKAESKIMQID